MDIPLIVWSFLIYSWEEIVTKKIDLIDFYAGVCTLVVAIALIWGIVSAIKEKKR